ncbi:MAG: hypothetical protein ACXVCI_18185 [Bdellovibrionota bacterium]
MNRKSALLMAVMVMPGPATRVVNHDNDDANLLAPGQRIEINLQAIDQHSRRSTPHVFTPWSDVGWKANKGLVGERYNDSDFEESDGWAGKHAYLKEHSTDWVLKLDPASRAQWIAKLSPAEKYDLLLGISGSGLANNIDTFLEDTLGSNPAFPSWWGLCEGSAPASVIYPEPVRKVVLHSEAYNLDIPFYAPDIKGLATMLWSRFNTNLNLPEAGTECKTGEEASCFDSNPATFHASVHHFLDMFPSVLIGEMDPSPVVWNFPLVAYSESYFRPDKGASVKAPDLAAATLPLSSWPSDPRHAKRSPGTVSLVGVKMEISYGVNQSTRAPNEGSSKRKINSRTLTYELELNSNQEMLGGEWVSGDHPDLLWSVPPGTVPDSPAEALLPPGDAHGSVVPKSWAPAAKASAARLTPLRRVVDLLVKLSAK